MLPCPSMQGALTSFRSKWAQLRDRDVITDSDSSRATPRLWATGRTSHAGGMMPDWRSLRPIYLRMG
jgi:hypothetical protein